MKSGSQYSLHYVLIIFLIGLLYCCNSPDSSHYRLNILFDNVNGLVTGDEVQTRGLQIGSVDQIKLHGSKKVLVEVTIDKEYKIPLESSFTMENADLLGSKLIDVSFSDQPNYYQSGDTVEGEMKESFTIQLDSLINRIKLDSIISGIHKVARAFDSIETK